MVDCMLERQTYSGIADYAVECRYCIAAVTYVLLQTVEKHKSDKHTHFTSVSSLSPFVIPGF